MYQSPETLEKIRLAEERERRFIEWYYDQVNQNQKLVECHISPVGNMANFDGWYITERPDGTRSKNLIEAKVRHGSYKAHELPSTYLTIKKFKRLTEWRHTVGCDKVLHLTFYIDALIMHDLTPWADGKRTFDTIVTSVRSTQMDDTEDERDEDKYLMMHTDGRYLTYDKLNAVNSKMRFVRLSMGDEEYFKLYK